MTSGSRAPRADDKVPSESSVPSLLEHVAVGVAELDADGRLTFVNDRFCALVGRDRGDLLQRPIEALTHPHDRAGSRQALERCLRDGSAAITRRYVLPDRQEAWVHDHLSQVRRDGGPPSSVVLVSQRATDFAPVEAALRESETRYRRIFETAAVALWEEDFSRVKAALDDLRARGVGDLRRYLDEHPEFVHEAIGLVRVVDVNPATLQMFEAADKAELLSSLRTIFLPETDAVFTEELLALAEGRSVFQAEAPLQTVRGRRLSVLFTIAFPDTSERLDSVLVSLMDITARKEGEAAVRRSEEELREQGRITETLNRVGALVAGELDHDKAVQAVTDAATQLTGAQFGAFFYNVIDRSGEAYLLFTLSGAPREAFAKFPNPRATSLFGPTFRGEGVVRIADVTVDPRYGTNAPYHGMPRGHLPVRSYLAVPVVARSGEVLGGLFFGHADAGVFTERHEQLARGIAAWAAVSLENARLYRQAQDANRVKDEFLATLSHELRTPLNAILGWSTILRDHRTDAATTQRAVEIIERNARLQTQMIEDLLDVSRILTGKFNIRFRPVDVAAVIAAAVDAVRPMAANKAVALEVTVADGVGQVSGDADRLQQIVWNLLTNAIKFTPQGGLVSVRTARTHSQLAIEVHDTGVGIKPEFLPHVFDRFRQADSSVSRAHSGLGLGLSIARYLTEAHGGRVTAASDGIGTGSTFTISLPVRAVHDSAGPSDAAKRAEGVSSLAGLRVLVVDDDADARELLSLILERHGAAVAAVPTAADALTAIGRGGYDVMLADIGMPGEDGYALLRRLRALPAREGGATPAIAVTAYASLHDRQAALGAGYDQHLPKPVEPERLLDVIASAVRHARGGGR